jgi:hypothetical protein
MPTKLAKESDMVWFDYKEEAAYVSRKLNFANRYDKNAKKTAKKIFLYNLSRPIIDLTDSIQTRSALTIVTPTYPQHLAVV